MLAINRRRLIKVGAALIAAPALLIPKPARAGAFVGCICKNTVDSGSTNFSNTVITWSAEDIDTDGFHSTSSNTGRITIPSAVNNRYGIFSSNIYLTSALGNIDAQVFVQYTPVATGTPVNVTGRIWRIGANAIYFGSISSPPRLLLTSDFYVILVYSSDASTVLNASRSSFCLRVVG